MLNKSFVPSLENLKQLWLKLASSQSHKKRIAIIESCVGKSWLAGNNTSAPDIVDVESLNPGPSTRVALIFAHLQSAELSVRRINQHSLRGIKKVVRERVCERYFRVRGEAVPSFRRHLDNAAVWKSKRELVNLNPFLLQALAEELDIRIRNKHQLLPLEPTEIFTRPFNTTTAITDFCEWICGTPNQINRRNKTKIPLLLEYKTRFNARHEKLKAVVKAIQNNRRVINLHCQDQWMGLTAVSTNLTELIGSIEPELSLPPVCYISLAKTPGFHEPVDLPSILIHLHAFYIGESTLQIEESESQKKESVWKLKPPATATEVEALIKEIRLAILKHPAILIFDGLRTRQGRLPAIETAIRDDDVQWLLERLAEPLINHQTNDEHWQSFNQTFFIVTSDQKLTERQGAPKLATQDRFIAIDWPRPCDKKLWKSIIPLLDVSNLKWIELIHRKVPDIATLGSENLVWILDSCATLVGGDQQLLAKLLDRLKSVCDKNQSEVNRLKQLKAEAFDWIWLHLQQKPLWRIFWLFLAISTSGLRKSTFRRIISEWNRMAPNLDSYLPEKTIDIVDLEQQLDKFEVTFQHLVARKRRDHLSGYDDMPHPFEQPNPSGIFVENVVDADESASINITLYELKSIITELIARRHSYAVCCFAHRLTAEESIRQQTIAFRHSSDEALNSIRGYRRQLEALYHGFLSLPANERETEALEKNLDVLCAIPMNPEAAWHYLTKFAYMQILERQDYHLSRAFGADEIKSELVSLALDPVAHRESKRVQSVVKTRHLYEHQGALVERLKISNIQAAYMAGRGRAVLAKESQLRQGGYPRHYRFLQSQRKKILKQSHDWFKFTIDILMSELDLNIDIKGFHQVYQQIRELTLQRIQAQHCFDITSAIVPQIRLLTRLHKQHNFDRELRLEDLARKTNSLTTSPRLVAKRFIQKFGAKQGSEVVDLLNRVAETIANETELVFLQLKLDKEEMGIAGKDLSVEQQEYTQQLILAFSYLRQAEALRLQLFALPHISGTNAVSGHSARLMTRVTLKLEQLARYSNSDSHSSANAQHSSQHHNVGYFGQRARRMADIASRYLFDYPRERASMLIIESSIARTLSAKQSKIEALNLCLRFLSDAEQIVESLDFTARLRLRFKLERCKVLRELASEYFGKDQRDNFNLTLKLAQNDSEDLERLASNQSIVLWWKLSEIEAQLLSKLKREAGLVISTC